MPTISSLRVYPVKGCKAICIDQGAVKETGLAYDRHWLVVTADSGRFFSQRNEAKLALVEQAIHPPELLTTAGVEVPPDAELILKAPNVPLVKNSNGSDERHVICWEWKGVARDEGAEASAWFSEYLGKPSSLVRFLGRPGTNDAAADPTKRRRPVVPAGWGAIPGHEIAFSDRLPFLMTTEASLQGLNEALGKQEAVPMERFRPNIVVSDTGEPFSEDAWEAFSVQRPGHTPCKFKTVVPCDRCKVTTTNQETLKVGKEPLQTLAKIRSLDQLSFIPKERFPSHAVFFGWLCVAMGQGSIRVGDEVVPSLRDGPIK
ncbi:g3015 [Coccomyxa elongata]